MTHAEPAETLGRDFARRMKNIEMIQRVGRVGVVFGVGVAFGVGAYHFLSTYEVNFPSHTVKLKIENPTNATAYASVTDVRHERTINRTIEPKGYIIVPALYAIDASEVETGHIIVVTFDDHGPLALPTSRWDSSGLTLGRLTVVPARADAPEHTP